ncbi:MAG: substrate-binding domain-containing protein [Cyclobacteriaceae bacterium]
MESKKVRIKDIALLAGVSVGTVDRVIHKRGNVSKDIEEKINGIIEQLGYEPNLIASTLGSNKSYRLAVLMPSYDNDPYWEGPFLGIKKAEKEFAPYSISIEAYFFEIDKANTFVLQAEQIIQSKPDGILLAPVFNRESLSFFSRFEQEGIPFVLFNTDLQAKETLSYIGQDSYQSGVLAGHLLALGLPKGGRIVLAHIDEDIENSTHLIKKEKGFKDFFEKYNGKYKIDVMLFNSGDQLSFDQQMQALCAQSALAGIFVTTSKAYKIANYLKLHEKKDIMLVGYDLLEENLDLLQDQYIHFLINQNSHGQGYWGIAALAEFLLFKRKPAAVRYLPLDIITRENASYYIHS